MALLFMSKLLVARILLGGNRDGATPAGHGWQLPLVHAGQLVARRTHESAVATGYQFTCRPSPQY
ncbi:hypothetical protein [Nocardia carnea]|uniref:Secreted protein n=1 Tax=Nocardia carnea TaxID=37328 RepID=A0ABW7TJT9_9NOCA|nr:hypothetical protein [Nocardia carnea]